MKKEAVLYKKIEDKKVHCFLCSHNCKIAEGKFGICAVRQNINGTLYSLVYGSVIAANVDPIEKKPFYHFLPGSKAFSIATIGCNFRCGFCQNWEISQRTPDEGSQSQGMSYSPENIVEAALKNKCQSISYTYTEPTIYFEYAYDTAKIAKQKGLYNNFVTNGFMSEEALRMIHPYLDAANVDLKFFNDDTYKSVCAGRLEPVLKTIKLMRQLNIWVEVTTLVVPGLNDSEKELGQIAKFLAAVDKDMPWHISRFYPNYKFDDRDPTEEQVLKKARETGFKEGLRFVYVGNVYGWGNNTNCPACKKLLLQREGFSVSDSNIKDGKCKFCSHPIPGIF